MTCQRFFVSCASSAFGLWAFAALMMTVTVCILVYLCMPRRESELVLRACHPLHASRGAVELHMTSI